MLLFRLLAGFPQPSHASDTGHAPVDLQASWYVMCWLFIPPMCALLLLGLNGLFKWLQSGDDIKPR